MKRKTIIAHLRMQALLALLVLLASDLFAQTAVVRNQGAKIRVNSANTHVNIYGSASNYGTSGEWINFGHVRLSRDWLNNSATVAYHTLTGDWYLIGNTEGGGTIQEIEGSNPGEFERLHLVQNNKVDATLVNNNFTVADDMELMNGVLFSSSTTLLIFADDAVWSGTPGVSSHVHGPVRKLGDDGFRFPIGRSTSYLPLVISAPGPGQSFTAEYLPPAPPPAPLTPVEPTLVSVNDCEFFRLTKDVAGNDVLVGLNWDNATNTPVCDYVAPALSNNPVPNQITDLRVARWDAINSIWVDEGIGVSTGDENTGGVTSAAPVGGYGEFRVAEACPTINPNLVISAVTCPGANDASATVTPTGGVTPYTFQWFDVTMTPFTINVTSTTLSSTADMLAAGTYFVTITDAQGCEHTEQVDVTTFAISLSAPPIVCNGDEVTIDLTILNGAQPFTVDWVRPGNISEQHAPVNAQSDQLFNAGGGTYDVTVTDNTGCVLMDQIILTEPTPIVVTAVIQDAGCGAMANQGAIDLTVSGGVPPYTFEWSNLPPVDFLDPEDISMLVSGNYTVQVQDANGCIYQETFYVPTLTVDVTKTDITCFGDNDGTIMLVVSGGQSPYTYAWSGPGTYTPNSPNQSNLPPGIHQVTVTSSDLPTPCVEVVDIEILEPALLTITPTMTEVTCEGGNDGTITANPAGGTLPYLFDWDDDGTGDFDDPEDRTMLIEDTYIVVVQDANLCEATNSIDLTTAVRPTPDIVSVSGQACPAAGTVAIGAPNVIVATDIGCPGEYEWEIIDLTNASCAFDPIIPTFITQTNELPFTNFCNFVRYDNSYEVRVRSFVPDMTGGVPNPGDAQTLTPWSSVCSFATGPHPVVDVTCPSSPVGLSEPFTTTVVPCANRYSWELRPVSPNPGLTLTGTSFGPSITLSQFANCDEILFGETYEMYVRTNVGGCWSTFGNGCTFTTDDCPVAQITSPACFGVVSQYQDILINIVTCSFLYEVEIRNHNTGQLMAIHFVSTSPAIPLPEFTLDDIGSIPPNTTIDLRVRPYFNNVPCDWGPTCTLTTELANNYCVNHPVCEGDVVLSQGSITVNVEGGISPYHYHLYKQDNNGDYHCFTTAVVPSTGANDAATHTFAGLNPGAYTVQVFDSNPIRCIDPFTFATNCPAPPGTNGGGCVPNEIHTGEMYLNGLTIGIDPNEFALGQFDNGNPAQTCFPFDYTPTNGAQGLATNVVTDQLQRYPLPRFEPNHTLRRSFVDWMALGPMAGQFHSQPLSQTVDNAENIQLELAHNWNYTMTVGSVNGYVNGGSFDNNSLRGRLYRLAQQQMDSIETSSIVLWGQLPDANIQRNDFSTDHYVFDALYTGPGLPISAYQTDPFGGIMWNPATTWSMHPDPAVAQKIVDDGQKTRTGLLNLKSAIAPLSIDRVNENGEVRPSVLYNPLKLILDNTVANDMLQFNQSPYNYLSQRKYELRKLYADQFTPDLPGTAYFSWYQMDGYGGESPPGFFPEYGLNRTVMTQQNNGTGLQYFSTSDFYVRFPSNWKRVASGPNHGWGWIDLGRYDEINEHGDLLSSPFVAAGWHHDPTRNVRPGQWLGLLKAVGMTGAEYYYPGYFNVTDEVTPFVNWRIPAYMAWQSASPGYAQATTSRFESYLRDGTLLENTFPFNSNTYGHYSLTDLRSVSDGGMDMLVVAREDAVADKFVLTGLQGVGGNFGCASPLTGVAAINLTNTNAQRSHPSYNLSFEVRRQGSSYLFDYTDPSDPVFYQIDKWHQYEHPERWTKDLIFEAEVWDDKSAHPAQEIRTQDENGDAITNGDYSEFVSYLTIDQTQLTAPVNGWNPYTNPGPYTQYLFQVREDGTDYELWVKTRTQGSTNPSGLFVSIIDDSSGVEIIGDYIGCLLNNEVNGNNDDDFEWFTAGLCNAQGGSIEVNSLKPDHNYWLRISPQDEFLEIDSVALIVQGSPDHSFTAGTPAANCTPSQPPVADFDWVAPCLGNTTQFVNLSQFQLNCSEYIWDFGDGNVLTQPLNTPPYTTVSTHGGTTTGTYASPAHEYQTTGTFTVTLTMTNPVNQTDVQSYQITIADPPTVTADITARFDDLGVQIPGSVPIFETEYTICRGESAQLEATVGAPGFGMPYQYLWTCTTIGSGMGLNDQTIYNPLFNLPESHEYEVTISDAEGCTGTDIISVRVNDLMVDAEMLSCVNNPTEILLQGTPGAAALTNQNILNNLDYVWTENIIANPNPNPVPTFSYTPDNLQVNTQVLPLMQDGDEVEFELTITDQFAGCMASGQTVILAAPVVDFRITAPCIGNLTTFDVYTDTGDPIAQNLMPCSQFEWNLYGPIVGSCPPASQGLPIATSVASAFNYDFNLNGMPPGEYYVTLQITNLEDGVGSPALFGTGERCFTVFDKPQAIIEWENLMGTTVDVTDGQIPVCLGNPTPVTAINSVNNSGPQNLSYRWFFPQGGLVPNNEFSFFNMFFDPLLNTQPAVDGQVESYDLIVTDALGCTDTASIDFEINVVTANITVDCAGPSPDDDLIFDANPSGGTPPYTFNWVPTTGLDDPTIFNPECTATAPVIYIVTVQDVNLCSTIESIEVTAPVADFTVTNACVGQDVTFTSTSTGLMAPCTYYVWDMSDGTQYDGINLDQVTHTFTGGPNVSATLTVSHADMSDVKVINFTLNAPPVITSVITDVDCNGNSTGAIDITVTGAGGYTFDWAHITSGPEPEDVSGLPAGNYSVTVTDVNGCFAVENFVINEPPTLTLTTNTVSLYGGGFNISCNGGNDGAITVTAGGGTLGYTYSISPAAGTQGTPGVFTNLPANAYTITVTDINNCTADVMQTLTEPTAITGTANVTDASCAAATNGSVVINASGGVGTLEYDFGSGYSASNTNSGYAPGNYSVDIRDANLCVINIPFTIAVDNSNPVVVSASAVDATCNGACDGSVSASASGGTGPYTFDWGPAGTGPMLTGLCAGMYTVTATDIYGCSDMTTVTVGEPAAVTASLLAISDVMCGSGTLGKAEITATGGNGTYTFVISPLAGTQGTPGSFTDLPADNYTVTVTDGNGCSAAAPVAFTVGVNNTPPMVVDAGTGGDIVYDSGGGGGFISPCVSLSGSIVSGGTGGYTYSWSASPAIGSFTAPTAINTDFCLSTPGTLVHGDVITLTLMVTDQNGCTASDEVKVIFIDLNSGSLDGPGPNAFAYMCNPSTGCLVVININANPWQTCSGAQNFGCNTPPSPQNQGYCETMGVQDLCANGIQKCIPALLAAGFVFGNCPTGGMMVLPQQNGVGETEDTPVEEPLLDAFPNPFNSGTTIRIAIPVTEQISLDLFDVTGRLVSNMYTGSLDGGVQLDFELPGYQLRNGTYIIRLQTANETLEKRIVRID